MDVNFMPDLVPMMFVMFVLHAGRHRPQTVRFVDHAGRRRLGRRRVTGLRSYDRQACQSSHSRSVDPRRSHAAIDFYHEV